MLLQQLEALFCAEPCDTVDLFLLSWFIDKPAQVGCADLRSVTLWLCSSSAHLTSVAHVTEVLFVKKLMFQESDGFSLKVKDDATDFVHHLWGWVARWSFVILRLQVLVQVESRRAFGVRQLPNFSPEFARCGDRCRRD